MTSAFAPTFDRAGLAAHFDTASFAAAMLRYEAALADAVGAAPVSEALLGLAAQCGTVQCDSAQCGTAQCGTAQSGPDAPAAPTSAAPVPNGAGSPAAADLIAHLAGPAGAAAGNPAVALVGWLKAWARSAGLDVAAIHPGATSQDVIDSALMLVTRDALETTRVTLGRTLGALAASATTHASTPDAGRTLMQPAWPVTFGYRAAQWGLGLADAVSRLDALSFPVQYGGAVGTLAVPVPGGGAAVRAAAAQALGLADPGATWHTRRQSVVDLGHALASVSGAIAKIAGDLVLLGQGELGAVAESTPGGSSAMPHKRNPVAAASARACALRAPQLAATLYAAMPAEFERGAGTWHTEWETLAELVTLTGSAAAWLVQALDGLEVFADRLAQLAEPAVAAFAGAQPDADPFAPARAEALRLAALLTNP
ncbi:3-carboxy-cis,cis-muconate cycloisomerase [Micrococcales bacterium 31B]|nr:3-carboxy-cis,cis-muconate cycloisomerase [Micrococcales bacterium 31B]